MCIKWAAPVTRGKPRRGSLGVTNKAHLPETARPTTHEHAAARSHFFLSFFRDSTISATRCAREFPIKTAYNGACLWAHVYWVHTILISIKRIRPRPVSKNAERFLRGPRRILMLNKKKSARTNLQRLRRPHTSCGAPEHHNIGAARFLHALFKREEFEVFEGLLST